MWIGGNSVTWRIGDLGDLENGDLSDVELGHLLHGQRLVFHITLAPACALERTLPRRCKTTTQQLFKAQIHGH